MRAGPLPVIALTGFLGSGKTTLLKHWLTSSPHPPERSVLVINDFGPVNIDAALLGALPYELRSIAGGCVCCTSYGELIDELDRLADEDIDIVWLETSGLAEPEEVLDHLTDPQLRGRVEVHRLVQVIDAASYPGSWRHRALEEGQIRFADILVLNKADLVPPEKLEMLEGQLRALNDQAELVVSEHGGANPDSLWSSIEIHRGPSADSCKEHACGPAAATHFVPLPEPVSRELLLQQTSALPAEVARAKGLVKLQEDSQTLYALQFVQGQASSIVLPIDDIPAPLPPTGLVLIGPQLDAAVAETALSELISESRCK